jgi:uroporphyrinogen decarboxylase
MNRRDTLLNLAHGTEPLPYVPAAFFLHFAPEFHAGPPAIEKQLDYFRRTGMDLVKIQYEQGVPQGTAIERPEDWHSVPVCDTAWFAPTLGVAEGLVQAAQAEAVVVLTIYSPFMWAKHLASVDTLTRHLEENPAAVQQGLEVLTENVRTLVRGCQQVGIDGFYISTQGGEAGRFGAHKDFFERYIKPTDLAVWAEAQSSVFNILHVCDYERPYDDLSPFLAYPGHVVNCSLQVGARTLTPGEAATMFKRPFMGGLERKGILATGTPAEVKAEAARMLASAPERFMLGADCTVPGDTPWENLAAAIETAHEYRR